MSFKSFKNNLTNKRNFDYTQLADGSLKITKYKGSDIDVTIPSEIDGKKVTSIGRHAFMKNSTLTSIVIPNSVTSIGSHAFKNCSSLASVTIPSSVKYIECFAFDFCKSLTDITVDSNNKNYSSQDGVLFNKNKTKLIQYPIGNTRKSYTIPSSVKYIDDFAFFDCSSLTSITIPNSVTSIGWHAFEDCSSLTSITIPNSVTSIGDAAFSYCSNLENVTIPDSVKIFGIGVFDGCESLNSGKIVVGNSKNKAHSKELTMSRKDLKETADRVHNQPKLEQTKNKEIEL